MRSMRSLFIWEIWCWRMRSLFMKEVWEVCENEKYEKFFYKYITHYLKVDTIHTNWQNTEHTTWYNTYYLTHHTTHYLTQHYNLTKLVPQNLLTWSFIFCHICLQWDDSLTLEPATLGLAAKYAAILFQNAPALCSLATIESLLVFNQALMRATSSIGVHALLSLRSAGVSSYVAWLLKRGTWEEETSTLSWT